MSLLNKDAPPPRLVLLDTAHLAGWFADRASDQAGPRARAEAFEGRMDALGWVPLLTWHHLEELLQHQNQGVVSRRLSVLHSLPRLAWISALRHGGLGSIVDVTAAEAWAAYQQPQADLVAIVRAARSTLVRIGPGKALLDDDPLEWLRLQKPVWRREAAAREIVAINQSNFADLSKLRVGDLLAGQLAAGPEVGQRFAALERHLATDIAARGDRRIADPNAVAKTFMAKVAAMARTPPVSVAQLIFDTFAKQGVEPSEIDPQMTMADLNALAMFRTQLRLAGEQLGIPWPALRDRVGMDRAPSFLIGRAFSINSQALPEHKGSELNDAYLLRAGVYADRTCVDKRTLENLRRARQQAPFLDTLVGEVVRASTYDDAIGRD